MGKLVALAMVLGLSLAHADPQPTPQQKAKASELVKSAIAKSQAGDHEAAIELYQQAHMIIPQPLLLSNIGSEYKQQGKKVEAIKYFCMYLKEDPTGTNASYAGAQVKTLQIELGNEVEDADVCTVKTKPVKETPPPPVKETPPPEQTTGTIGIEKGVEKPHASHTLEYTGIAVGVVGLATFGAGVYYGLQAKRISDSITNHDTTMMWPTDIKAQEKEGQNDQTLQIAFMITGGVVAGVGVLVTVIGHDKASSAEHVSIRPVATQNSIGLTVGGGF
jgi:hypothetical protein